MTMCYWCQSISYCQSMDRKYMKRVEDGEVYCQRFGNVGLPLISMGRTSPPWVNDEKTVTRREWATPTRKQFKKGRYYLAMSKQKMFGGQPIGIGRMTEDAFLERTGVHRAPGVLESRENVDLFYAAEGFQFLDRRYREITDDVTMPLYRKTMDWIMANQELSVVPFEIVEVFPQMQKKYSTDDMIIRSVKNLLEALP